MCRSIFLSIMIASLAQANPLNYPESRKEALKETLHGTPVSDPYRWLEDDDSAETKAWVAAQNVLTQSYLATIPQRDAIHQRLKTLWDFERIGQPQKMGNHWFFNYNSGLQNQAVLKVTESLDDPGRVLLDPATLSDDGTVALADWEVSEDGKLVAWAISRGGSDWHEIFVREVATGKDLGDHLKWIKSSLIAWAKDGSGFYYSRYDASSEGEALTGKNEFHKLYFHQLGSPQSTDRIIYQRKDRAKWGVRGFLSEDCDYLLLHISKGTETSNRFFYQKIGTDKVVELLDKADASYGFIGNDGPRFYFRTNLNAPRYRVIAIDIRKPDVGDWQEVIAETDASLDSVDMVGGQFICQYLEEASTAVRCHNLDGQFIRRIELPGIGTASGFNGRNKDSTCFYSFSSFTDPGAIYQLDLKSGKSTVWRRPEVGFRSSAYVTKQVFVTSKDGTKVPIFIVHKRGLNLDGSHRTLLYGYGGFDINLSPGFSVSRAVWLERGGVFVLANLRGGGEYGSDWHKAGTKLQKQNVFDDFFAAAHWLIDHGYTSSEKLAIQGGSNGGLLVGACMTQQPRLFGACLPAVGVMDMLRFHKFTIGWGWQSDYGSPDDPEEFEALLRYSPYHNLKPGTYYPATLVTTADHDDRVVPAHSFKFAARLQECQAKDGPPTLIRIALSAGHGAGTALDKTIDRIADEWAFLEQNLKAEEKAE